MHTALANESTLRTRNKIVHARQDNLVHARHGGEGARKKSKPEENSPPSPVSRGEHLPCRGKKTFSHKATDKKATFAVVICKGVGGESRLSLKYTDSQAHHAAAGTKHQAQELLSADFSRSWIHTNTVTTVPIYNLQRHVVFFVLPV